MPHVRPYALAKTKVMAMKLEICQQLFCLNQGFQQALQSLHELAKHYPRQAAEIRRFEQLTRETRSATNSYLLEVL